jgi:hypothetical protein
LGGIMGVLCIHFNPNTPKSAFRQLLCGIS